MEKENMMSEEIPAVDEQETQTEAQVEPVSMEGFPSSACPSQFFSAVENAILETQKLPEEREKELREKLQRGDITKKDYEEEVGEHYVETLRKNENGELDLYYLRAMTQMSQLMLTGKFKDLIDAGFAFGQNNEPGTGKDSFATGLKNIPQKEMTPEVAKTAFASRLCGVRSIRLFNSGMNVTLRALTIGEKDVLVNSIRLDDGQLGSALGVATHFFGDVYVKETILKFLYNNGNIISCDLQGWQDESVFFENLSINDYDAILWGLTSLMYRNGITVSYDCSSEECSHVRREKIDVERLRINNYAGVGEEAFAILNKGTKKTPEDLKEYREKLKINTNASVEWNDSDNGSKWVFELRVPSAGEFIEYGKFYSDYITTLIHSEGGKITAKAVKRKYDNNSSRALAPWIKRIYEKLPDGQIGMDYEVEGSERAKETVPGILEQFTNPQNIVEGIVHFMYTSRITYICYSDVPCPKCGATSKWAVEGIVPYDMQTSFFIQLNTELGLSIF